MKTTIHYIYILFFKFLSILLVGLILVSCVKDKQDFSGIETDEATLRLTISTPGTSMPRGAFFATRSTDDTEHRISDVRVLVFTESGGQYRFSYMVRGLQVSEDENDPFRTTFSVRLKTSSEPLKLLLVGNSEEAFTSYNPIAGTSENDVKKKITTSFSGLDINLLPMFGEKTLPSLDATQANTMSVTMLRALARLDVQLDLDPATSKGFVIESVHIFRANDQLQTAPDTQALAASESLKVTAPSVPANAGQAPAYSRGVVSPGDDFIEKLYLPEAEPKSGDQARQTEATCVVIGGYYDGQLKATYYRADFDPGLQGHPFGQVLRNHRYQMFLKRVTGQGWETPEEAANNRSTVLVAEIQAWEDFTMEMFANGDNYLGISSRSVILSYKKDARQSLRVQSTVPYLITWDDTGESATEGEAAISNQYFRAAVEARPEEGDDISYLVFTSRSENNTGQDRVSRMTVHWENWKFSITVTQRHQYAGIERSVRVLSVFDGTTGHLGSHTSVASGSGMRGILSNMNNFSPAGTVDYLAGFQFSLCTQAHFSTPDGTNNATHLMRTILYGTDVLYMGNDNRISEYAASAVMEWLESSPNRVLIVSADAAGTSPYLIRSDLSGPLAPDADWYYNASNGGSHHYKPLTAGSFRTPYISENNREFLLDGPFGPVAEWSPVIIADGYWGYAASYKEDIVPLLVPANYPEYMIVGVDKKRRIVYSGDASLFQSGMMGGGESGSLNGEQDKLWANIWSWISYQVIWGDSDRF